MLSNKPSNSKKEIGIRCGDRKGFALITAILAVMILMALGFLAISVTTGDLRITSRIVGEKKALAAAEAGIHDLMRNFVPGIGIAVNRLTVDAATDPASVYSIANVGPPTTGPATVPMPGFGPPWIQQCYIASVTGENTNYDSSVTVNVGMGYLCWGGTTYQ